MELSPPPKKNKKKTIQINSYVYENVSWDAHINKKLRRYANCKHCIAVHLILKHNQKGSKLRRVRCIIYQTNMKTDFVTSHDEVS
jgi:hypothetical protein